MTPPSGLDGESERVPGSEPTEPAAEASPSGGSAGPRQEPDGGTEGSPIPANEGRQNALARVSPDEKEGKPEADYDEASRVQDLVRKVVRRLAEMNERPGKRPIGPPTASGRAVHRSSYRFTGPLPPPEMIAEYEAAIPGLSTKIVQQFMDEGEHRRMMEREHLRANEGLAHRNMDLRKFAVSAIVVVSVVGLIAAALVALVSPVAGVSIAGIDLAIWGIVWLVNGRSIAPGEKPGPRELQEGGSADTPPEED